MSAARWAKEMDIMIAFFHQFERQDTMPTFVCQMNMEPDILCDSPQNRCVLTALYQHCVAATLHSTILKT